MLIHDYTLCLTGSPYYNVSYYNYISIWPYYIVIHLLHTTSEIIKETLTQKWMTTGDRLDLF